MDGSGDGLPVRMLTGPGITIPRAGTGGVHHRVRTMAVALASVLGSIALAPPAAAQGLNGRVIDSETGQALAGASVTVARASVAILTDSLGRFQVRDLRAGATQVAIRLLGYAHAEFSVIILPTGDVDQSFPLDFTGNRLPAMAVQARAEQLMPRYLAFEARRQRAAGAFLRWDELAKQSFGTVGDALRTVRGVRIQCNQQTFECFAVMSRTPQCQPTWIIDGMEAGSFHENTPVLDVYGIEVYRGPGEVPGEYSGSNAACGVIVLWTKSRPFRVKP